MLDTNACIDVLRDRDSNVLGRLDACKIGEVAISSITMAELQHGVFKGNRQVADQEVLTTFCEELEILPFDELAAEACGRIRAALERAGTPIGLLNTLIAAHALSLDCALVTNNENEFRRVDGLAVENWIV